MSLPLPLLTFLTSSLRCTDDRRFTAYYCDVECNLDEGMYNSGPRTCSGLIQASVRIHVCLCACACMCMYVRVRESLSSLSLSLSASLPSPSPTRLTWLPGCLHHHQLSLTRPQTDRTLLTSRKAFRARAQRGRASAPSHRIMTAAKVVLATIPKALIHCF